MKQVPVIGNNADMPELYTNHVQKLLMLLGLAEADKWHNVQMELEQLPVLFL
jgi:hypothetical protein